MCVMRSVGLIEMYVTATFQAQVEPYRQRRMSEERRMEVVARRVAERNCWLRALPCAVLWSQHLAVHAATVGIEPLS
jgi:hypothetical protein